MEVDSIVRSAKINEMTQKQLARIEEIITRLLEKGELSKFEYNLIMNSLTIVQEPCIVCKKPTTRRSITGMPVCIDCSH